MPRKKKKAPAKPNEPWPEFCWILLAAIVVTECVYNLESLLLVFALFLGSAFFIFVAFCRKSLAIWLAGLSLWIGAAVFYLNVLGFFPFEFSRGIIDIVNALYDTGVVAFYYWSGHDPYGLNFHYVLFGSGFALGSLGLLGWEAVGLKDLVLKRGLRYGYFTLKLLLVLLLSLAAMCYLGRLHRAPIYLASMGMLPLLVYLLRNNRVLLCAGAGWLVLAGFAYVIGWIL